MDDIRNVVLTGLARGLNVLGAGLVTIPSGSRGRLARVATPVARVRGLGPHLGVAELFVEIAKDFFHRGRPFDPSWRRSASRSRRATPSPGPRSRWRWCSCPSRPARAPSVGVAGRRIRVRDGVLARVPAAHWLSDVVAGVLLGAGVALGVAATVTEIRHHVLGRWWPKPESSGRGQSAMTGTPSASRARTGRRQLRFRRQIT
jgi:hypothetical protein